MPGKCKSPDTTAGAFCQQRVRKQVRLTAPDPALAAEFRVRLDGVIYRLGGSDQLYGRVKKVTEGDTITLETLDASMLCEFPTRLL